MMDIPTLVAQNRLSTDDLLVLAGAHESPVWQALKRLMEADLAETRAELENGGQISELDFSRDFRYKLGSIKMLDQILGIPGVAKGILGQD